MTTPNERATKAVKQIVEDMTDRSGLGNAWDDIDEDTASEILEAWRSIIFEAIVGT